MIKDKEYTNTLHAFTMIELVFIIVILGILASIALPRLATSRDDAVAVAIKSDIGTILQAVPAMYMSQGEDFRTISQAVQIDRHRWIENNHQLTSVLATANQTPCVQIEFKNAAQDDQAYHVKVGDKILEIIIQDQDSCTVLHRMFQQTSGTYKQIINLSGYGIRF